MKKKNIRAEQLIAMIDYPPLHSPEAFVKYREKFKADNFVDPVVVVPVIIVIEYLAKSKNRYNTYQKILKQFLANHSKVEYFMTDGKHRSAAATILGKKIPCIIVENDTDIEDVKKLVKKGEITSAPTADETFADILEDLEEHYFEHKRFWTMDEKTKAMIKNGDIL